ncbi:hypothetical protein GX48_04472 [Paracoccidioides brasiliensis]|nr:hypothetical protein GX48_04472 [Paracoccidioides brasiliensis]
MADTPITWHPHTKDDPLTRLGQGTDTDISIMNSTMVTPPSRLRRKHRSMLSNPRNPEAVKEVLVMAFGVFKRSYICWIYWMREHRQDTYKETKYIVDFVNQENSVCLGSPEQLNPATSIDSQWPLKSMPVPKWRITIRAVDMGKMQEYFRSSGYKSVDALRILPADDT